jgi:hypothetical protein
MSELRNFLQSLSVIICFFVMMILSPLIIIWNALAMGIWGLWGTYLHVDENGLRIQSRNKKMQKLILWQDIESLQRVYHPPIYTYEIILTTGNSIAVDFLSEGFSVSELENRGIMHGDAFL